MVTTMVRTIGKYAAIYGGWLFTCALGLADLVFMRQALIVLAVRFVGKWARSAAVSWPMLLIGLVWLVVVIFTENYYREGAERNLLPKRFLRVTAAQLGILIASVAIIELLG